MTRFKAFFFSSIFIVLAATGAVSHAQTGSITGQVFDPAGRALPNATLTATSTSTGAVQSATTSSAGLYNFATLPPSTYNISVTANGFETVTRNNVILNIAAILPINFTLTVGSASQTVNVAGDQGAPIETDSTQLSTVIDSKQINDLPLILRDPYQLVLLSPGVVHSANNDGGFSVNGQRDRNNNFMLDGADNNDTSVPGGGGGLTSANPDSAQEFRVISNNFDAEYGRNTGAIIDVVTRGGTNAFHGDAYEFGRYSALAARDFFNTKANGKENPFVRNDFGASVGGPLWKDHTFFFLNGEVQRFRTTLTNFQTTPTAAYKSGVFTYIDPTDGSQTPVNLTNANPNNVSMLGNDPTITKLLNTIPTGQADNGDGVTTTYFFPSPDALNSYALTGRLDHKLTEKHQVTIRYNYIHSAENNPFHDEILPGLAAVSNIGTSHNGVISIASTVSASATNLLRASYNLSNQTFNCGNFQAIDGITGVDSFGNGTDITLPSFFTYGCGALGDSNGQGRLSSTLLFGDTFTLTKGAHSMKFGGEYRDIKDSNFDNFSSRDAITLNEYTNFGASAYKFAGNPNSPSLLTFQDLVWGRQGGVATQFENQFFNKAGVRQPNDLTRFVQHEFGLFAQDTWKVSPQLTAILGLRYEFNGVPYEREGNFSNFYGDPSAPVPASGFFSFTTVGPGTGKQLYADSWKLFEPRIGIAFDPKGDGKTAIRAGFGVFHDRLFDNIFGNAKANPPFQAQQSLLFSFTGPGTIPTAATVAAPGNLTPSPNVGNGSFFQAVVIDPKLKIPGTLTWNFGVQHQFGSRLTTELNYVGSHGTHGLREINTTQPSAALVQQNLAAGVDPALLQNGNLYFGTGLAVPTVNNTAFYYQFFQTASADSNYNSLQAKITEQVGGLNLLASYTWAHSLDNGSDPLVPGAGNSGFPRDSTNLAGEYGNSDFDVRNRGTVAASYDLPIGHGKQFLANGFVGRIFEGIQLSGIEQVQTGLPFDLRGTRDNLHTGLINRPQLVGKAYPSGRGTILPTGKITGPSAAAFSNAPFGQALSIGRDKYYGPGFVNTDVVVQKTQTIFEGVKMIFRAESYNVLNHPNLNSPPAANLSIASPNFGVSNSEIQQNDGTTGARQIQGAIKLVF